MARILFRCDASLSIGTGHVMRCRTLARVLALRGAEVLFVCRRQPGDLISLLMQEFAVLALPEQPLAVTHELFGRKLYRAWLGCSQDMDVADCLEALLVAETTSFDWVVVDHYGLDATWEKKFLGDMFGDVNPKLLVIDDLADRPHEADVLLDQNFVGEHTEHRYQGLVDLNCRMLLGPHYALLGPEYALLHPLVPSRTELRRVMVFFGGVDISNFTRLAIIALMVPEYADVEVDVVLGRQSLHKEQLIEFCSQKPNIKLHEPLPSLAGLITRADLAIGAGGATFLERACLGLPSLVIVISENQYATSRAYAKKINAPNLCQPASTTSNQLRNEMKSIYDDPCLLNRLSREGKNLCDGKGAERVAHEFGKLIHN